MKARAFFLSLVFLVSCTSEKKAERPQSKVAVVVLSIDGAKPSVLRQAKMPRLKQLADEGSVSWSAQTIVPSITLPSHVSMLTGVPPEKHKILWNDWLKENGAVEAATVFGIARKEKKYKTAFFATKEKFKHFDIPGALDKFFYDNISAEDLVTVFSRYFRQENPDFSFLHFYEIDSVGHKYGWGSAEQVAALEKIDHAVGALADTLKSWNGVRDYVLIISADHGGIGKTHGSDNPEDVTIPWIAWGSKVKKNQTLTNRISTMDTAATSLYLLGIPVPSTWNGRPIMEAFDEL